MVRTGTSRVLVVLLAAVFAAACSSQGELTKEESGAQAGGPETAALLDTLAPGVPHLPRPPLEIDDVPAPQVLAEEREPLLDRARMHIVLAAKALENGDTLTTVDQCAQASDKLDRASYLPDIEEDAQYVDLNARLRGLYRACAVTIEQSELEVPASALAVLADEAVEEEDIDLTTLTFKEPPPTVIPLPLNKEVEKNIVYFTTKMRKHFVKWLERSGRYFPVMRPILKEEGMPDEIIYLTMIESGVNPTARSWAACVGLWQFLKSTGEMYGLRGDWHTDDRCDPEKATRAAARHLRDLYNRFGDWHLALAAYNAGAGRISRAIKKSRKEKPTFWDIVEFLPRETQNYVPRFIATAIVALDPHEYDLAEVPMQTPLEYDVVSTDRPYHIKDLATAAGTTPDVIEALNPTLLQPQTPPRPFDLRVPKGKRETFAANVGNIEVRSSTETVVVEYRVKRGDNLYKVAKKHNTSVGQIVKLNELSSARHLRVGEILRIPRREVVTSTSYKVAMDNVVNPDQEHDPTRRTAGREKIVLPIEPGMTLGGVAHNYGVTVADLMTWNSMGSDERLIAGRTIDVWVKPDQVLPSGTTVSEVSPSLASLNASATAAGAASGDATRDSGVESSAATTPDEYTVQRGETLASIAGAFNLTIQNLVEWNRLESTNIRSGSTLKLKPAASPAVANRQSATTQEKPATQEKPGTQEKPAAKKSAKTVTVGGGSEAKSVPPAATSSTPSAATSSTPSAATSSAPAGAPGKDSLHVVRKGETLYRIATAHGTSVEQLMEWNGLPDPGLHVGQKLVVVRGGVTKPAPAQKTAATPSSVPAQNAAATPSSAPAQKTATAPPSAVSVKEKTTEDADAVRKQDDAPAEVETDEEDITLDVRDGKYVVQPGDNLYRISRASGLSVEELKQLNGLTGNSLRSGQELIVVRPNSNTATPAKTTQNAAPAKATPNAAPAKATPAAAPAKAAPAGTAGSLRDGAADRVDPKIVSEEAPNAAQEPGASGVRREHIVKKGETLHGISRALGIPVSKLSEWNEFGRFLKVGQKIVYYTAE